MCIRDRYDCGQYKFALSSISGPTQVIYATMLGITKVFDSHGAAGGLKFKEVHIICDNK